MVERTPVPREFKPSKVGPPPVVPDGRYAVQLDEGVKFYKINTPQGGKWAGFTFVEVQASDEFYPIKGVARKEIIEAVAKDPQVAAELYGREIGVCGICGRTLTRPESRARGIGPICAEERGW